MLRLHKTTALWRQLYSSSVLETGLTTSRFATKIANPKEDDDSRFELLPPGCSMVDPAYAIKDSDTTVLFYDEKEGGEATPQSQGAKHTSTNRVLSAPSNIEAAKKNLEDAKQAAEDEPYVYLPPGCSMKDPGYGHNSMSDPLEKRVHIRDPHPPKE